MTEIPEGLHAVPDIGDEGGVSEEEALKEEGPLEPSDVEKVFAVLEEQNAKLVNQLALLGRGINPLVLLKIQVDTLIDFSFGDDARAQYNTACAMRLNETLKTTIAQLVGAQTDG